MIASRLIVRRTLYVFVIVPLVVAAGLWVGIHYGSYAAGGSDSYGGQHSGSVRYYANRITLRYDYLAPDGLDAVLNELIKKGYQPYIVMDDSEEPDFRRRFAATSRVGRLDWRPLVRISSSPQVRIYDPEGRSSRSTQ